MRPCRRAQTSTANAVRASAAHAWCQSCLPVSMRLAVHAHALAACGCAWEACSHAFAMHSTPKTPQSPKAPQSGQSHSCLTTTMRTQPSHNMLSGLGTSNTYSRRPARAARARCLARDTRLGRAPTLAQRAAAAGGDGATFSLPSARLCSTGRVGAAAPAPRSAGPTAVGAAAGSVAPALLASCGLRIAVPRRSGQSLWACSTTPSPGCRQHIAGRQPAQVGRALHTGRGVRCSAPAARGPGRAQGAERALPRQLARERGAGRLALRQPARQRSARGRHQLHHRADLRAPRRGRPRHRACQRPDADALWAGISPVACSRLQPCACPPACDVARAHAS
jgi:hypothetical protein